MKKLLLLCCCLPVTLFAQNFYFSGRIGLANYQGDLHQTGFTLSQSKFLFSAGARYDLSEHIAARSYLTLTGVQGDDAKGSPGMQQRNLNFKSKIFEWELGAQYNFLSLNNHWWTPYVFAGLGVYHFNPYTYDSTGDKVLLQPLSTEGEGFVRHVDVYKRWQLSIPYGFGADFALNEDMRVGIEFGFRKLFTDYMDDVSGKYVDAALLQKNAGDQAVAMAYRGAGAYPAAGTMRGSGGGNDSWYFVGLTFTIRSFIDQYKRINGLPGFKHDKKVGCPATRIYRW
ncbi:DUF6089 family protein [Deminuibacter soli]|uniref:Outer membrane protein beta-barrel domain-containing protein n=1 Tax=Deminuibacter soli TaxID=2291815 RepID=A0A3E1NQQ8_9BACT|nr:DUF6089 family protein [Deminuibacter soli]RFM30154.1 hypothetical protein DXN05_04050 [Deminuibacter soli]